MKTLTKILLLALVSLLFLNLPAQITNYRPFVEEGKHWEIIRYSDEGEGYDRFYFNDYYMFGDSIIFNDETGTSFTYKKVFITTIVEDISFPEFLTIHTDTSRSMIALVREDAPKVYIRKPDTDKDILLYDFEQLRSVVASYYTGDNHLKMVTDKVWRITQNYVSPFMSGYPRYGSLVYVTSENNSSPQLFVEGIGNIFSPFNYDSWDIPFSPPDYKEWNEYARKRVAKCYTGEYNYSMEEYDKDVKVEYEDNIYRTLIEGDIVRVSVPLKPTKVFEAIFDLQGRSLAAPPAHGVYIQGGRKYAK